VNADIRQAGGVGQLVAEEAGDGTREPGFQGHREALFRSGHSFGGHTALEHSLQQVLRGAPTEAQIGRERTGELDEGMIK
jgi:hypothetical protein